MADLDAYRASDKEKNRTNDLLRLLPKSRKSILDIGARDGHFSRIFTMHFESVTALDLQKPSFEYHGVTTTAGDVTTLQFPDDSFDCVFCAEVLEHIPAIEQACRELVRVARHEIVVGVPYRQDTRVGRTTCQSCRKSNPPWGHVNTFDERRLRALFPGLNVLAESFVEADRSATNALSTFLFDLAGNPWGTYDQDEPCIYCGKALGKPTDRPIGARICSAFAARIDRLQAPLIRPHPSWIHIVFQKLDSSERLRT